MTERWRKLVAIAETLGYTVDLREYVECADSPGILGSRAGVCLPARRLIVIRSALSDRDREIVLTHELQHALEPTREAAVRIDSRPRPTLDFEREPTIGEAQDESDDRLRRLAAE